MIIRGVYIKIQCDTFGGNINSTTKLENQQYSLKLCIHLYYKPVIQFPLKTYTYMSQETCTGLFKETYLQQPQTGKDTNHEIYLKQHGGIHIM